MKYFFSAKFRSYLHRYKTLFVTQSAWLVEIYRKKSWFNFVIFQLYLTSYTKKKYNNISRTCEWLFKVSIDKKSTYKIMQRFLILISHFWFFLYHFSMNLFIWSGLSQAYRSKVNGSRDTRFASSCVITISLYFG